VLPWTLVVSPAGARHAFAPVHALERRWLIAPRSSSALSTLFAWGVARSVKAPLAKLETAAAQIAAGDLTHPLPSLGSDEIGRLGASFEAMRRALSRRSSRAACCCAG
jgi:HAMP domain-containing protein